MLSVLKKQKLIDNLKIYYKKFLNGSITELDESGTRIMVNHLLTDVFCFTALEEVKTEYMIKGTYADYVIQVNGVRHFLVEVKAFSLILNESHLRQSINYGANEGIEWALLTNGKVLQLYKIIFEKPINSKLVFNIDLTDFSKLKSFADDLQFLHKDEVLKNGLELLWNKSFALYPENIAKHLLEQSVVQFVRRSINKKFDTKFSDAHIQDSIFRIIAEKVNMEGIKVPMLGKKSIKKPGASSNADTQTVN